MTNLPASPPRMMLVGEAWGEEEERQGKPFVSASGRALHSMLRSIGVDPRQCYFTNVFNFHPRDNKLENLRAAGKTDAIPGLPQLGSKLWIAKRYESELTRLYGELNAFRPNVIVALGATPLWALCGETGIKKSRGTPRTSRNTNSAGGVFKVLPTYHPAAVLRQWSLRPIVLKDLEKAWRHATSPTLTRPRRFIHMPETIADLWSFHDEHIAPAAEVSCDIETKSRTITEVGFAPSPDHALVVPFLRRNPLGSFWRTLSDEVEAWRFVQHVLKTKPQLGQNFSYDLLHFQKMNCPVPRLRGDTMILHHTLYPEMEKSLGFLGSIYTEEPSWKFMRQDAENFKAED